MKSRETGLDRRGNALRSDILGLGIAVLVGTTVFQLLYALVDWVIVPLIRGIFKSQEVGQFGPESQPLYVSIRGFPVYWGEPLVLGAILAVTVFLALFLRGRFLRPVDEFEVEQSAGISFRDGHELRECPECLSRIPISARRCAFCGSALRLPEQEG